MMLSTLSGGPGAFFVFLWNKKHDAGVFPENKACVCVLSQRRPNLNQILSKNNATEVFYFVGSTSKKCTHNERFIFFGSTGGGQWCSIEFI